MVELYEIGDTVKTAIDWEYDIHINVKLIIICLDGLVMIILIILIMEKWKKIICFVTGKGNNSG